jgi:hypothetical protein
MTDKTSAPAPAHAKWSEQKIKLQKKFPTLTDSDLKFEENQKEEMFKSIQAKLGTTREELNKVISAV